MSKKEKKLPVCKSHGNVVKGNIMKENAPTICQACGKEVK